jgi:hypothetical protein
MNLHFESDRHHREIREIMSAKRSSTDAASVTSHDLPGPEIVEKLKRRTSWFVEGNKSGKETRSRLEAPLLISSFGGVLETADLLAPKLRDQKSPMRSSSFAMKKHALHLLPPGVCAMWKEKRSVYVSVSAVSHLIADAVQVRSRVKGKSGCSDVASSLHHHLPETNARKSSSAAASTNAPLLLPCETKEKKSS